MVPTHPAIVGAVADRDTLTALPDLEDIIQHFRDQEQAKLKIASTFLRHVDEMIAPEQVWDIVQSVLHSNFSRLSCKLKHESNRNAVTVSGVHDVREFREYMGALADVAKQFNVQMVDLRALQGGEGKSTTGFSVKQNKNKRRLSKNEKRIDSSHPNWNCSLPSTSFWFK
jgi:hypothetical protein